VASVGSRREADIVRPSVSILPPGYITIGVYIEYLTEVPPAALSAAINKGFLMVLLLGWEYVCVASRFLSLNPRFRCRF
jgi:hypothetical protein